MKHNILSAISVLLLTAGLSSCTDGSMEPDTVPSDKVAMNFTFSHPSQSRATETSFESGDVVGLYVSEAGKVLGAGGDEVPGDQHVVRRQGAHGVRRHGGVPQAHHQGGAFRREHGL